MRFLPVLTAASIAVTATAAAKQIVQTSPQPNAAAVTPFVKAKALQVIEAPPLAGLEAQIDRWIAESKRR